MHELISAHDLQPHPEGGFFRETYRSPSVLPGTQRSVCTAIMYLLGAGQHSRLHRIDADELWHFYGGDPLHIVELREGQSPLVTRLSARAPQHVVRAGTWFGSLPAPGAAYCFVGCTVSPGFEFAHFELGERAPLLAQFPEAAELIAQLTP